MDAIDVQSAPGSPVPGHASEWRSPVSEQPSVDSSTGEHASLATSGHAPEEERPPTCPSCNRRLVILATHMGRDDQGRSIRRQLWGCPRGHATAYRDGGVFSSIELLASVAG